MGAVPGSIDTDRQPPMIVPLRHFAVAVGYLVVGCLVGVAVSLGPFAASLAHVHLLLVGSVCVTIMGAMTQFVPVWSGVRLHSRRLATAQLWLVAVGVAGFAAATVFGPVRIVPAFGALMALGILTFVYNVWRTLPRGAYDVTEFHFALALGFFVLVAALGLLLAVGLSVPVFGHVPVSRAAVVSAHATLAVFGAVLTTVFGALYQLATMFTQTDLRGVEVRVRRFERTGYPLGVVALAAGRLLSHAALARFGGALLLAAVLGMAFVLARRLAEARVERTPMLSRYAVLAAAMALWAALAIPAWLRDPLAVPARFGAPGAVHLLGVGVVGFVVVGTLYHIVPFIVWVHRYSDRLGFEDVPMVDDLYDDRLAAADFALLLGGTAALVAGEFSPLPALVRVGGALLTAGVAVFATNLFLTVNRHSPRPLRVVLFGALRGGNTPPTKDGD